MKSSTEDRIAMIALVTVLVMLALIWFFAGYIAVTDDLTDIALRSEADRLALTWCYDHSPTSADFDICVVHFQMEEQR